MDKYIVLGRIGEGAHGLVLRGQSILTGKEVALKKVMLKKMEDSIPNSVVREIKTLQQVDCKYVMKLLDYFAQGVGFVLVFEFMPSGLWEILHDVENPVTEPQAKTYMQMLLRGLAYLHDHGIMHRDLKPANLLISSEGVLRIADLGLGRMVWGEGGEGRPYTDQVATRWYRAPELLYGARHYTKAIDLWATGCILAELANKAPLFPGETDIEQLALVLQSLGTPTETNWPGLTSLPDYNKISFPSVRPKQWDALIPDAPSALIELAKALLVYDANKRLSARQALIHAYFLVDPLPCPMAEMPHPPHDYRQRLKPKELSINKSPQLLFHKLQSLLQP